MKLSNTFAAVTAVAGLFAVTSVAQALPVNFADPGLAATASVLGIITSDDLNADTPGDVTAPPSFTFTMEALAITGGQREFEGLNTAIPPASSGLLGLELFVEAGALNNGKSFTLSYDRAGVSMPTNGEGGVQTGTMTFTITDTPVADLVIPDGMGTQNGFTLFVVGLVTTSDAGSVYVQDQEFSILFNGTYGKGADSAGIDFTISSPPSDPPAIAGPASLAFAGFGLALLGFGIRHRQ